jgi:hypothetical protein
MTDVMDTRIESTDLLAAKAVAAMQDAFKSDVERDLTRGTFDSTAQFSRHSRG